MPTPLLTLLAAAALSGSPEIDVGDVSRGPDACPSQSQIADALDAHLPGVLARVGRELGPNVLHLDLAISPEGQAHLTLTDATGGLSLERDLDLPKPAAAPDGSAPPRAREADCAAIADTLALIVERYVRHLGFHEPPPPALVPPPPPPPAPPGPRNPRALVGVGASVLSPWTTPVRVEPEASVDVRVGRLSLAASGGVVLPRAERIAMTSDQGQFTRRSYAGRLALGWVFRPSEALSVVPSVGGGVDVIVAETQGIGATRRSSAIEPVLEGGLSATYLLTRRFWIGARAFQGIDLRPEEFFVTTDTSPTPLTLGMTPRAYVRLALDFGVTIGNVGNVGSVGNVGKK